MPVTMVTRLRDPMAVARDLVMRRSMMRVVRRRDSNVTPMSTMVTRLRDPMAVPTRMMAMADRAMRRPTM